MDVWLVEADRHTPIEVRNPLVVRRRIGCRDQRHYMVLGNISGPDRKLVVNANDVETLATSIMERVLYYRKGDTLLAPLTPTVDVMGTLRRFTHLLVSCYGTLPTPRTPEEFVESYTGRRRTIYGNALDEYYEGVTEKHARITAFVKAEKVPRGKSPRCIQPRNPVYNVGVGRYLKHIEHKIFRGIARVFRQRMVVAKGYNVAELGMELADMWDEVSDPVFIGFDASRFDFHVGVDVLCWEHSVYNALYNYDPELCRLLRMQLSVNGSGYTDDGKVKYSAEGRRMSGDMNTGLGNCLIVSAIVFTLLGRGRWYKFVNNGDDCGVIVPRSHAKRVSEVIPRGFEQFGFRMVVEEPVCQLEKVVFCQMQPVEVGRGNWRMVRQPDAAREKDSMILMPFTCSLGIRKWMRVVGEGGLALCSGVPVFQEMYKAYIRMGLASNMASATFMERGAVFLAKRMEAKEMPVTSVARASFWEAFDMSPEEQEVLENHYRSLHFGRIRTGTLDEVSTCQF